MYRFGLIGKQLSHTFSPAYFQQKWAALGRTDCHYTTIEWQHIDELPAWRAQALDFVGLNVTIPYKTTIIPYLDDLHPTAQAVGAVNTIAIRAGRWIGYNTDALGFEQSLRDTLHTHPLHNRQALILGTGGASRAVAYALQQMNISYQLVSRQATDQVIGYDQLTPQLIEANSLIINTTPLGMYPHVQSAPPLPYEAIGHNHLLFDLVYNPIETLFLQRGRERQAHTQNGLPMLHAQADAAWQIWQTVLLDHT